MGSANLNQQTQNRKHNITPALLSTCLPTVVLISVQCASTCFNNSIAARQNNTTTGSVCVNNAKETEATCLLERLSAVSNNSRESTPAASSGADQGTDGASCTHHLLDVSVDRWRVTAPNTSTWYNLGYRCVEVARLWVCGRDCGDCSPADTASEHKSKPSQNFGAAVVQIFFNALTQLLHWWHVSINR